MLGKTVAGAVDEVLEETDLLVNCAPGRPLLLTFSPVNTLFS